MSAIKIKPERLGLPGDRHWKRLNDGMAIEVAGLRYRRPDVIQFIEGANRAGRGRFGIVARREPENIHSKYGTATAIDGWWTERSFFGAIKRHERHLGYLPEWASHECFLGKCPEPTIHLDIYSLYLGPDGFVDVDIIVHVEKTPQEVAETKATLAIREARKQCLPGLKVLARLAVADGQADEASEIAIMKDYVAARTARLELPIPTDAIEQIVEAARGLAPSDQAVLSAARSMAEDDEGLNELFRFALALARADGDEDEGEIHFLRRVVATARRKRMPKSH